MVIAPKLEKIKHTEMPHHHQCLLFPSGFLWGSSTSSHQVEGGNINNDWWDWENSAGKTKSGKAVDHYNRYEEDFDLAKKLNTNAHRLSVEWSRIEPKEGEFNQKEIQHYRDVLKALKSREMKVMLTLYHFTLPKWFSAKGGWLARSAVKDFNRFAKKVVDELGDLVDFWITINEPFIYATQSYTYGDWPPQKKSNRLTYKVISKLAKAHKASYKTIHQKFPKAMVGFANNVLSMETYNKRSLIDFIYMAGFGWLWNHSFYFLSGKKNHDYIGVNYYFHQRVYRKGLKFLRLIDARQEGREHSDLGWEVNPSGFFDALLDMSQYKLPIYITENGIAAENDDRRARYIVAHVQQIYHAISQKIDIKGYFHWSLLDNFEWDKGFEPRFGLIHIDYKTLKRTIKDSALVYGMIAEENTLCHKLMKYLGHSVSFKEIKKTTSLSSRTCLPTGRLDPGSRSCFFIWNVFRKVLATKIFLAKIQKPHQQ